MAGAKTIWANAQRRTIASGVGAACAVLLVVPGLADAQPRVILSPLPGQMIDSHPVRIEVKAGPEYGDLSARLNGKQVGEHFARKRRNLRVLPASNAHGLRHGDNVLRVKAWRRGNLRRATVHFTVGHTRPMSGAGLDRVVPAGTRFRLRGHVRSHPSREFGGRVRWRIVGAPKGSDLKPGRKTGPAAEKRMRKALRSRRSLAPGLRPDVLGTYKLEMKAGQGTAATADTLTVTAAPQQPLVPIETHAPARNSDPRLGIQVGDEFYRAPWLGTSGEDAAYSGTAANGAKFTALWQVLSLERSSLGFRWNRTYGVCVPADPNEAYFCRRNSKGEPAIVNPSKEIADGGDDRLVIAVSQASLALPGGTGTWGQPNGSQFAVNHLDEIGLPATTAFEAELVKAGAGDAAVIGVPGMKDSAQTALFADGRSLYGHLTPDQHAPTPNYGWTPSARIDFNTRAADECPGGCYVSQTIGDQTHTSPTQTDGTGGYLVSANDPHTLTLLDSQYFQTVGSSNGSAGVEAMTSYLKLLQDDGALISITSLKTPGIPDDLSLVAPDVSTQDWDALRDQIVAFGGTKHRFNLAAITPAAGYSLLGWSGAKEGEGEESMAADAVIRGTLVPDVQYRYRPINSTTDGTAPPNRLADLIARPPSDAWPQNEDDANGTAAGGDRAMRWLGLQYKTDFGTVDPRAAYWAAPITAATADRLRTSITIDWNGKPVPAGQNFTQDDFDWAVQQLLTELGWVSRARTYMTGSDKSGGLANPAFQAGQKAWQTSKETSDTLLADLKQVQEKAEVGFDVVAMLEGFADVVAGAVGAPKFENIVRFIHVAAGLIEEGGVFYEADWDGGSAADELTVEADDLGDQLQARLQSTSATFDQMADIVVSDPVKLAEVGTYGNCPLSTGGCDPVAKYGDYYNPDAFNQQAAAVDLAERGVERAIWEELVPHAFPVWDIAANDQSYDTYPFTAAVSEDAIDLEQFSCNGGIDLGYNDPFTGAPRQAWTGSLEHITPKPTEPEKWRTRISVARSKNTYGWLTEKQLAHMFGSVESGGVGIDAHDWMRDAEPAYVPASNVLCGWLK